MELSEHNWANRVFSQDVTVAILVSQNNKTAAMLVSQTNPVGVKLFSYANAFFCSNTFAQMLKTFYISETICPKMLVFGKQASWMLFFQNILTNPIISQIYFLYRSHFKTLLFLPQRAETHVKFSICVVLTLSSGRLMKMDYKNTVNFSF